ncbi:MAG: hypothetical protein WB424_16890, partial [Terracidiphilus sp.]
MALQPRRRAGIPKNRSRAKAAPPAHLPVTGRKLALPEPVVVTVTVVVPVGAALLKLTVELPAEQVGRSVALAGEEVSAQATVTLPAY